MTWNDFPLTLNMHQVAEIYGLHVKTVRRHVESGSSQIPVPNFIRPYRWRRDDVERHWRMARVSDQRRALLKKSA